MAKILMKGNEAIGEAAIRAGCLNYFGYPITPQSEIAEYLSRRMPEVNGMFLQAESEVAASYMIFGAAAAGARVFTTSSSPGISLMSEGISYVAAAQCPAVYVNIMRGGPGLGGILPSQGDYFQATKGGGHGDYHLLVMAPNSVQESVEMVMKAFPLAEKYRNPVIILGDGLIGQMMEPVEFPDHLVSEPTNKDAWATNGMATRNSDKRNLIRSLFLVGNSLEDNNRCLKAKYDQMKKDEIMYATYNTETDYEALIVSYGTMSRVCRTAIELLKKEGIEVGMIRPQTLFPYPDDAVQKAAWKPSCKVVTSMELSMGQMVEDVERVVHGKRPVTWFGVAGGIVPAPEEIVDEMKRVLKTHKA
jgi:2-oxoglutarate ferredoxin oxidoreductase subunit alpha